MQKNEYLDFRKNELKKISSDNSVNRNVNWLLSTLKHNYGDVFLTTRCN